MTVRAFYEERSGKKAGYISMYSGPLSEIPDGWAICDGNNGTPNLLGKFLKGVNTGDEIGRTGGQESWTMSESQMPSHSHSGSTDSDDHSHNHKAFIDSLGTNSSSDYSSFKPFTADKFDRDACYTSHSGNHSHNISVESTGGASAIANLPAYYEIAFIMRL